MTQVIDFIGGEYRNRTGVHGFAIRCVTTPPTRQLCGRAAFIETTRRTQYLLPHSLLLNLASFPFCPGCADSVCDGMYAVATTTH